MLNIALFGAPGAGKGTQSKELVKKYDLTYISTGDILRKEIGIEQAKTTIRKLRLIINVIDSSEKTIDCALNSDFSDFEDAIQYYTAQNHNLSVIVTRNVKDYKDSNLSAETPEMFLCSREFV